jgi:hypothetical protein
MACTTVELLQPGITQLEECAEGENLQEFVHYQQQKLTPCGF